MRGGRQTLASTRSMHDRNRRVVRRLHGGHCSPARRPRTTAVEAAINVAIARNSDRILIRAYFLRKAKTASRHQGAIQLAELR